MDWDIYTIGVQKQFTWIHQELLDNDTKLDNNKPYIMGYTKQ